MKKYLFIILSFIFTLFLFFVIFFSHLSLKEDEVFLVDSGSSLSKIGVELKNRGAISNFLWFKVYYKFWSLVNGCYIIHPGEYNLSIGEHYSSVLDKFCNGKSVMKTITIPEGMTTREIIEVINTNNDLSGNNVVFFEEGKLMPESYSFKSGTKKDVILEKMKDDFINFVKVEWSKRDPSLSIKNVDDAIILASIVEKEAKTDDERPIIASVYLNRLQKNIRLEACPTAIYEITKGKYKLKRALNENDLLIKGDYNTYRKKGLPVAPICNPGKKSILAVLHPAQTDFLYFVAKEDLSGHYFSNNYQEHLKMKKFVKSAKINAK